jgi:hypothetical protein
MSEATKVDHRGDALQCGYEDQGPNCLIGSHGIFFARVQHTPHHNAAEYTRKFAAVDDLIAACEALLEVAGYTYMSDQELRYEYEAGNQGIPPIIMGRAALAKATTPKGT